MTQANICPNCGEFVSIFAAGCAVCGTELDPQRGRRKSVGQSLRSAWATHPRLRAGSPLKSRRHP